MAKVTKSFGHTRKGSVPDLDGTHVKTCRTCRKWFAAYPNEQRCDGCVKPSEHTKRVLSRGRVQLHQTRSNTTKRAGQRAQKVRSSDLCRELALELAAREVTPEIVKAYSLPAMTKREAYAYTKSNVRLGLQGKCDLERYR